MSDDIAAGSQTVAIERRPDHAAVGKRDRSRTIPRFHQTGVVFIESPLLRLHVRIPRPCFRNQHRHRVRQAAPGLQQKFQGIVEVRGVAPVGLYDGKQLFQIFAKQRRCQQRLPSMHPVNIAPQGVDLSVVRDVAIRMGALPTGKCVGRKALVDQTESADHIRIGKLAVEVRELGSQHQPFVDDGSARKRRNVKHPRVLYAGLPDLILCTLAHHIQLALESVFVKTRPAADKNLLDVRLRGPRHTPNRRGVNRSVPPA